jgi:general secretion pathway protein K
MTSRSGERGFVLLAVLGMLALLALLGIRLVSQSRVETRVAAAWREAAVVEVAADSGVQEAAMRLLKGEWAADAPPGLLRVAGIQVIVRVTDEAVKINPNYASPVTLRSLIHSAGVDEASAFQITNAILEWRQPSSLSQGGEVKRASYQASGLGYAPSNRPFDNLDELELVLGMTPEIFARLQPFLTVYNVGDVRLDGASPIVANAVFAARDLDATAGNIGFVNPDRVLRIRAEAAAAGARFIRATVVRFKARPRAGEAPCQFLSWETGAN